VARKRISPSTRLVSYGQTPALSFCVDRAREILQFQYRDGAPIKSLQLTWKNSDESAAALGASATPRKALVEHIVDVASSPRAFHIQSSGRRGSYKTTKILARACANSADGRK
jgi:DNA topoisomerase IA